MRLISFKLYAFMSVSHAFPDEWYDFSDEGHFWFRWRLRALLELLRGHGVSVHDPLRALEVGCGNGVLRAQIERATSWMVDGVDVNPEAVARAGNPERVFVYDVAERRADLLGRYDVLILFDILEHLADASAFLGHALAHVKPGGTVLVNVPALPSLRSRYDEVVGHLRRYDPALLRAALASPPHNLEVLGLRYWGLSLVPILALRKLVLATVGRRADVVRLGFQPPGKLANELLLKLMALETRLVSAPLVGTSLMAIARQGK